MYKISSSVPDVVPFSSRCIYALRKAHITCLSDVSPVLFSSRCIYALRKASIYNLRKTLTLSFRSVSPMLPLKRFQYSSNWRWPSLVLSRKIVERFLFPRISPPGDRWCNVLGFVPEGSVSSSSTLQIFQEANHLWWLLYPPVCRLGRHVQDNCIRRSWRQSMARTIACTGVGGKAWLGHLHPLESESRRRRQGDVDRLVHRSRSRWWAKHQVLRMRLSAELRVLRTGFCGTWNSAKRLNGRS